MICWVWLCCRFSEIYSLSPFPHILPRGTNKCGWQCICLFPCDTQINSHAEYVVLPLLPASSPVFPWHLNSKAAWWWCWLGELPQTINKALSVIGQKDMSWTQSSACFALLQYIHSFSPTQTRPLVVKWHETVCVKKHTVSESLIKTCIRLWSYQSLLFIIIHFVTLCLLSN